LPAWLTPEQDKAADALRMAESAGPAASPAPLGGNAGLASSTPHHGPAQCLTTHLQHPAVNKNATEKKALAPYAGSCHRNLDDCFENSMKAGGWCDILIRKGTLGSLALAVTLKAGVQNPFRLWNRRGSMGVYSSAHRRIPLLLPPQMRHSDPRVPPNPRIFSLCNCRTILAA